MSEPVLIEITPAGRRLSFFVEGHSQTAGSKTAFVNPKTGKAIVTESGDRKAKGLWRDDVRAGARGAIDGADGWPLAGACKVVFVFVRRRPKGHYGSGRNAHVVKASAPAHPTTRPDALKLARAVEDALTGIAWHDDSQIVDERLLKRWGATEGVLVTIWDLEAPGSAATLTDVLDTEDPSWAK